ncbi:hypothetical protein IQ276_034165 [Desmonostoc muscorum LEGE 12446]|uniref:hypothetical protein n=1 Tax=Desmonostoc muscorum TaxID=1179 RepID=UPI001F2C7FE4|nr:hypothetical protein [Desmonostoc muscorum]MCF2151374.1 hypothetical protein [Desmonostoc muscorum LEGE 12446]
MTTTNTNKLLVIYEGQQHWIPEAIAFDDQLLRDAFLFALNWQTQTLSGNQENPFTSSRSPVKKVLLL